MKLPIQPSWAGRGPLAAIGLVGLAVGCAGAYYVNRGVESSRGAARLVVSGMADMKVGQISNWYKDNQIDAELVLRNAIVQAVAVRFLSGSAPRSTREELLDWMESQRQLKQYRQLVLYDAAGAPLLSVPVDLPIRNHTGDPDLATAVHSERVTTTDLHRHQDTARADTQPIDLSLWVPIRGDPGTPAAGVLLIEIDPYQFLFPLIQSWPQSSPTSETLLVRRDGNSVLYLNDLRHTDHAAVSLRLPLDPQSKLPAVAAALGREAVMEGEDYRKVPVLAATRRVPGTPWSMVAKVDQAEIYGPLRQWAWTAGATVFALMMAVVLGLGFLWRHTENDWLRTRLTVERERKALSDRVLHLNRHARDKILLTDRAGRILEANDRVLEAYGYTWEELRELNFRDLVASPDSAGAGGVESAEPPSGSLFQTVHQDKSGRQFPVELSVTEAQIGDDWYRQAVIRDITGRKQAEQALRDLNASLELRVRDRTAQLEASNRELEAFCYSVSHDLRAPLRGIDGWSLALLEDYGDGLGAQAREYLDRVRYDSQRMGQLIDDLLELSRVTREHLEREPVDLTAIAQRVAARLREAEPGRPADFSTQPGLTAAADPRLIEVVLSNLIGNAWKFSGTRPRAEIEFGRAPLESGFAYFVRDNGVGFDMAYAQKLFGAFQRLHRSSEFPGTGIGLATTQRIILRHGGRVWAEAQPDGGATFYFTLGEAA